MRIRCEICGRNLVGAEAWRVPVVYLSEDEFGPLTEYGAAVVCSPTLFGPDCKLDALDVLEEAQHAVRRASMPAMMQAAIMRGDREFRTNHDPGDEDRRR